MLKHFQAINVSAVFKAIVGEFDISLKWRRKSIVYNTTKLDDS